MPIIELAAFRLQHIEVILGRIAGDFPERRGSITPEPVERILDVQVAPEVHLCYFLMPEIYPALRGVEAFHLLAIFLAVGKGGSLIAHEGSPAVFGAMPIDLVALIAAVNEYQIILHAETSGKHGNIIPRVQLVAVHQAGASIQPPGTHYRIETLTLNIHRQEAQRHTADVALICPEITQAVI